MIEMCFAIRVVVYASAILTKLCARMAARSSEEFAHVPGHTGTHRGIGQCAGARSGTIDHVPRIAGRSEHAGHAGLPEYAFQ